jgi:glyoxylase-like metal-dependent hydrolase (beta-lactamase superfamily II)
VCSSDLPYHSATYAVRAARATRLLDDGDVVDLGDRQFEVIHTPGHSPGGIALWEAATGILFSGDILYDGPLIEDTYHSDAADYLRSMERLIDLPVRVVHGGHFPSFDGVRHRTLIRDWLDRRNRG